MVQPQPKKKRQLSLPLLVSLIIVVVIGVVFLVTQFGGGSSAETGTEYAATPDNSGDLATNFETGEGANQAVGLETDYGQAEDLSASTVRAELDDEILDDPALKALKPFGQDPVTVSQSELGRTNPFIPF